MVAVVTEAERVMGNGPDLILAQGYLSVCEAGICVTGTLDWVSPWRSTWREHWFEAAFDALEHNLERHPTMFIRKKQSWREVVTGE